MSRFVTVTLSDLGKTITGKTPSSESPKDFGDEIPFITPSDSFEQKYISNPERFLSSEGGRKLKGKLLLPESIMVTCIGSAMGKVAMTTRQSITNQQINSIIVDDTYSPDYIYYTLRNNYKLLRNAACGSTALPLLNKTDFDLLKVRVHKKKEEQKKIAAVLSTFDAKIECNNRINAELEAMAKTLYDYWFVQFNFPDHNGQPYKSSGGKMVYNPTLKRQIPSGWESVLVGDVLSKVSNNKKVPNKEILIKGKLPVIDQSMDYIGGFTDDENARLRVESAHIVFGDHTRILKLINFDYARGSDGTQVLISKVENIPAHLFFQMLSKIDLSSYGYARHFKFLKESVIILPNKDIAIKYEAVAKGIYRKIKHGIFENQHISQLRDWLLPMLMNGQVTVV